MKKLLIAALMLGAATGLAEAADPPMMEPVVVAPDLFDWSGLYVGAHGGGVWGSIGNAFDVDPPGPAFTGQPAFGLSGWTLGVQAGANMQSGRFVLGLEGRVAWVGATGNDAGLSGVVDTFNARWSASALLKGGVALGAEGKVVPYLAGGVTALNYDYNLSNAPNPPNSQTVNATGLGATIGGGIQFAINENVSMFVEYVHTFYGTNTLQFTGTPTIAAQRINVTPSVGTATVGVNFHF